jgi:hypothetical protein
VRTMALHSLQIMKPRLGRNTTLRHPQQSGSPKSEWGSVVPIGLSNPEPLHTGQSRGPVYGGRSPYP